jgi:Leucine-rich repeat (LRR) protein
MRQEKLLKIIEQALKDGVTSLDLNRCQLKALPSEISQLTNLTKLSLELNVLTKLDLSDNQLTWLPQRCISSFKPTT